MIEGLRAEFPSATGWIARLRRPAVARETIGWAFLSATGAGFIVGGILGLLLLTAAPVIFSATEPRPSWFTYSVITQTAASIAIGAVALRSGGLAVFALCALYQLGLIVATFPGRQFTCAQFRGVDAIYPFSCDLPGLIVDRWSTWLSLAIGAAASRWLVRSDGPGVNWLPRGAGVYALVVATTTTGLGVLTIATIPIRTPDFQFIFSCIYLGAVVIAGVLAGLVLWRARLAASVLVAALTLSSLGLVLPFVVVTGIGNEPLQHAFTRWTAAIAPVLGAASILTVRVLARRRAGSGTIF